jgi:hypothetical protein
MKKSVEQQIERLKKQKTQTNSFIELMEAQKELAAKLKFGDREASINELIEQENFYIAIINLKINKAVNQLKKFN